MGVINHRSNAKPKDQCHYFFERPARLRELALEFIGRLLRRWPDQVRSLADGSSNEILKCHNIRGGKVFIMSDGNIPGPLEVQLPQLI